MVYSLPTLRSMGSDGIGDDVPVLLPTAYGADDMMTTILLAAVLFGPICTECWQVDRPAIEIVQSLAAKVPAGPAAHFPPEAVRLLEIIHVYAAVEAWPARHYYRVTVRMLHAPDVPLARRLRHVEKTLEIWAVGDVTVIRSTLDIGWGR